MIGVGVGISNNVATSHEAAQDAAHQALQKIKKIPPKLVIVFAAIQYNHQEVLDGVRSVFPNIPIVGGSAAGEITNAQTVYDAIVVMALGGDTLDVETGICNNVSKNSFKAAACSARALMKKHNNKPPKLVITLFDGLIADGAGLVDGVKSVLGKDVPLIGGSTGDNYSFEKTYQYHTDTVHSGSVIVVGLWGDFSFGFGIRHGWRPVGLPMKVTKARGALLQELDNRPAISIYEDHLGSTAKELAKVSLAKLAYTYPLGLEVEGSQELLLRDPIIAHENGSITMAATIPEEAVLRLMIGNRDIAIEAAEDAARHALKHIGSKKKAAIMFNCMARNKLLGVRCREENEKVQKIIGKSLPMIGMYTYGEHGPLNGEVGTPAYFHNETMTLLLLGD
jgi:hypothetical protein